MESEEKGPTEAIESGKVYPEVEQSNRIKRINGKRLRRIRKQMEFYFSDANLQRDKMLGQLLKDSEDSYIDLKVFLTFNKIRMITDQVEDIVKAVSRSDFLEINDQFTKVRRKDPFVRRKINTEEHTVYVEQLPPYADLKFVQNVFQKFGEVAYISLPHSKTSKKHKGFAFVQFNSMDSVNKACEGFKVESDNEKNDTSDNQEEKCDESITEAIENPKAANDESPSKISRKRKKEFVEKTPTKKLRMAYDSEKTSHSHHEYSHKGFKKRKRKSSESECASKVSRRETKSESSKDDVLPPKSSKDDVLPPPCKMEKLDSAADTEDMKKDCAKIETSADDAPVAGCSTDNIPVGEVVGVKVETEDENVEESTKRKRKKKHDRSKMKLRVMTMADWRTYRNRYLAIQRKTMAAVKRMLLIDRQERQECQSLLRHPDEMKETSDKNVNEDVDNEDSGIPFKEGVIVKIIVMKREKELSADDLRKEIKSAVKDVAFVDTSVIQDSEIYLRFNSPESATASAENDCLKKIGSTTVLSGDNEANYWKKVQQDRINQRNRPRTKKRGREKILAKATKLLKTKSNHIFFEN